MISGYVKHGHGELALSLFRRMQNEVLVANYITFMGISSACCGTNLGHEDGQYCDLIFRDFSLEHYIGHFTNVGQWHA